MKRLSGWDAFLLYTETPNVHMHTLKIAVIALEDMGERTFGIDEFREVIRGRLHKLDPFRYQLVDIPFKFHHPMWRENCDVDLEYHVRPWRVRAPGGRRELDEAIGEIGSTQLDRSRPLWEMYFVEGLADGRIAVVGKIHHALADGVASANLLARGMDLRDGPQRDDDSYATDPAPTKTELVRSAFADHMRQLGRLPGTVRYTAKGFGRVRRSSRKLSPELTRPFTPPPSFMNHILDEKRLFATATLALADVKETSKKLGVTINDLVLAMSSGALRALSLKYDGKADHPLLASVPMSFDFSPDRISGNRFSGVLVALPVDVADTAERVQRAHDAAALAKESHQLIGPELIARWAAYMPPAPVEAMFKWLSHQDGQNKVLNLNISNVPGPRERGHVGGATVTEIYSVGPITTGSGLNITVWSYVDQLNISVLSDDATVDDPHEVTDAMLDEFREIRKVAGLSEMLTVVESAMPQ
ncbi:MULTISPECIES: wax ester/triacylglycerol synthase family O-acyltransferase [unclassified Mycolicibacterium]|uniref:WS/DGAT/MGAT family O-acyltransferase n=1 Tax=unclassified Mycolicibacterium TaxID=2636767 RepID=UPI00130D06D3|nr:MULTISPECIES: wax ester/triacylglycerol synthase family O-acyltransferase [unclassified Mycolicibacterium]MUL82685.1 wax ester/triacylglycerol synthase family O-acyltransferase [Mycolicibacterium sp. CBMA 329]MUL89020.1 wax ester/triacylglycerol synthase family O-acyltransferase [Mycolicibacterium sp. CBMA 331]MUL97587.1 wax ester/triacylglycerol synthase family O-acyltransferase [Mycolicibacterium sp. CBMA 334]MUM27162.1 wax ester/triacylglycerol synthase family O-acyltransferase [Mycolicib